MVVSAAGGIQEIAYGNIRASETTDSTPMMRVASACPVAALQAWREAAGITTGALFRSIRKGGKLGARLTDQSVAKIVKAHAKRVGLDPALFAGHSLRAGFLTSAAKTRRVYL